MIKWLLEGFRSIGEGWASFTLFPPKNKDIKDYVAENDEEAFQKDAKALESDWKKVDDILALVAGAPGPFNEDEKGFFGKKRVDPSMKDAKMETDCGGAMITKSSMTYGEADKLAAEVDLDKLIKFIRKDRPNDCYWEREEGKNNGCVWHGKMAWVIYSFLATKKYIKGSPSSYDNSLEHLYDLLLQRLVTAKLVAVDESIKPEWTGTPHRYYNINP